MTELLRKWQTATRLEDVAALLGYRPEGLSYFLYRLDTDAK